MIAKSMRNKSELAAKNILIQHMGCTSTCRAVKTMFQSVDMFASDVIGKTKDKTYYVQVTTGEYSAVQQRKKKMEKVTWCESDVVSIFQLVEGDKIGRSKQWYFEVFILDVNNLKWNKHQDRIKIEKEMFSKSDAK